MNLELEQNDVLFKVLQTPCLQEMKAFLKFWDTIFWVGDSEANKILANFDVCGLLFLFFSHSGILSSK